MSDFDFNNNETWYEHKDLNGNKYYDHHPEPQISFRDTLWVFGIVSAGICLFVSICAFCGDDFIEGILCLVISFILLYLLFGLPGKHNKKHNN